MVTSHRVSYDVQWQQVAQMEREGLGTLQYCNHNINRLATRLATRPFVRTFVCPSVLYFQVITCTGICSQIFFKCKYTVIGDE